MLHRIKNASSYILINILGYEGEMLQKKKKRAYEDCVMDKNMRKSKRYLVEQNFL